MNKKLWTAYERYKQHVIINDARALLREGDELLAYVHAILHLLAALRYSEARARG